MKEGGDLMKIKQVKLKASFNLYFIGNYVFDQIFSYAKIKSKLTLNQSCSILTS